MRNGLKENHNMQATSQTAGGKRLVGLRPQSERSTFRLCAVWIARFLVVILFILSKAKLVVVEDGSPGMDTEQPYISRSTAVLIFTHSRHEYLNRSLTSLFTHHPQTSVLPIFVSKDQQDREHPDVDRVVAEFSRRAAHQGITFTSWSHAKCYDDDIANTEAFIDNIAYRRISRHYKWALSRMFDPVASGFYVQRVIILEDDMEIACDTLDYFIAFTPMLEKDPSLFCVSAWNDNGIPELALNESQFHRTDFFPGLGWMLTRELWTELEPKWPLMFWDDWLRHEDQMKGRHCIRPEVSRTANFGKNGVSQSFHFHKHVSRVAIAKNGVNFSQLNLSYLKPEEYDNVFFGRMKKAKRLRFSNYLTTRPQDCDVIAFYPDDNMQAISKRTGIMGDHRNGMRRTSYKGVVVIPWNGHWAFLVSRSWKAPAGFELEGEECC